MKFIFNSKISLIMTLIICVIIFYFSSQSGIESSEVSSNLYVRKLGHLTEYALLGFFSCSYIMQKTAVKIHSLLYSFLFLFLYAISDEFHQYFVPGRNGNIIDVFIDFLGGSIGIFILYKMSNIFSPK